MVVVFLPPAYAVQVSILGSPWEGFLEMSEAVGQSARSQQSVATTARRMRGINRRGFERAIEYLHIVAAAETVAALFDDIDAGAHRPLSAFV